MSHGLPPAKKKGHVKDEHAVAVVRRAHSSPAADWTPSQSLTACVQPPSPITRARALSRVFACLLAHSHTDTHTHSHGLCISLHLSVALSLSVCGSVSASLCLSVSIFLSLVFSLSLSPMSHDRANPTRVYTFGFGFGGAKSHTAADVQVVDIGAAYRRRHSEPASQGERGKRAGPEQWRRRRRRRQAKAEGGGCWGRLWIGELAAVRRASAA